MSDIFTLENVTDFSQQINIDELFERKKNYDLSKLDLYNKLLNRIHVRIKTTAKNKRDEQFCWYVVPEIRLGIPSYDQANCISYLLDKLKENGFNIKYIHPNTLLIVWSHFVPNYIRTELKNKTGIVIDEYGRVINKDKEKDKDNEPNNLDDLMFKIPTEPTSIYSNKNISQKKFTPINSYKPEGKL